VKQLRVNAAFNQTNRRIRKWLIAVVAALVIFVIIVLAALFVFGGRIFSGNKRVDVNIQTPSK